MWDVNSDIYRGDAETPRPKPEEGERIMEEVLVRV
jgi:hypothetical protein